MVSYALCSAVHLGYTLCEHSGRHLAAAGTDEPLGPGCRTGVADARGGEDWPDDQRAGPWAGCGEMARRA